MERILTQKQLESALKEWQKILRLQDWNVSIKIVPQHEMTDGGVADITRYPNNKSAIIRVSRPDTYHHDGLPEQDMLDDIIHELLHLHFRFIDDDKDGMELEQAINLITGALLGLYDST